MGAVLKSSARRSTLTKNLLISTPKEFYEFSRQNQFTNSEVTNSATPSIHLFFLAAENIEQTKRTVLNRRNERFKVSGKKSNLFTQSHDHFCSGTIQGIRSMHEFQPISDTSILCRTTSRSSHSFTFTFK